MSSCALCRNETANSDLARVSGHDFCANCRGQDPAEALKAHDIEVEWNTQLMRFSAGMGIADQDPNFQLSCKPELWYHKLLGMVAGDHRIGDPGFDPKIWVKTSDPEKATTLLKQDAIQSPILAMLSGVRVNELVGNHVTLKGPTLLISTRPLGGLPDEKIQELKLEAAALALHLRY